MNGDIILGMEQILVVDDDPDILDALRFVLEDAGYSVLTTLNGEFAEKLADEKPLPKVIILDVLLSGKDGRDICRRIKKDVRTRDIPVIMISAHPNAKKSVMLAGADSFIPKPFDINILLRTVAKSLHTI